MYIKKFTPVAEIVVESTDFLADHMLAGIQDKIYEANNSNIKVLAIVFDVSKCEGSKLMGIPVKVRT